MSTNIDELKKRILVQLCENVTRSGIETLFSKQEILGWFPDVEVGPIEVALSKLTSDESLTVVDKQSLFTDRNISLNDPLISSSDFPRYKVQIEAYENYLS